MRQYLTATIQALSKTELDDIVDPYFVQTVKAKDPNPEIRVYSIGHEGEANLHLPGIGNKTFTWIQAAVRWVSDKLRLGTAVFDKHDPTTNSQVGREKIGEVVGKAVRNIGNRMNTLAAIYIYPEFRARPLDVASIEADIEFEHDGLQAWPTAINTVSGIALSNSGIDTPGFPGATLLGAVQAYVQAFAGDIGGNIMNLADVKAAVKELGLKPSQVYAVDDLMGDTTVDAQVREKTKEHFAMAKRVGEERDAARDKIVTLENANAESQKKLQQVQMQSRGATVIDSILTEKKLDDKAKAFVHRNMKNFNTAATDEAALKAELATFVDSTYTEYQELAKDVFGVTVGDPNPTLNQVPTNFNIPPELTVGGQPASTPQSPNTPDRFEVLQAEMNPDANPLIPGGRAAKAALAY